MADNVAILEGYNKELMAYADDVDLFILIKPETDLDSRFKAWDSDNQEFIMVNGWLFTFEDIEE